MKTLYESILSSTGSGKSAKIKEWCDEHNIFGGDYKILPNGKIAYITDDAKTLELRYDTYDALPDYIQFDDNAKLRVTVGKLGGRSSYFGYSKNIASLKGLPKVCDSIWIATNGPHIPSFEITANRVYFELPNVKNTDDITLNFTDKWSGLQIIKANYQADTYLDIFSNVTVKNCKFFDVTNAGCLGDTFSKMLRNKAPMNKYRGRYTDPTSDIVLELIKSYFGKKFDISSLEIIDYTQNSRLVKNDGKWYRCKNY